MLFSTTKGIDTISGWNLVLNIGTTNASTINIGGSSSTVNILGSTNYIQTTNLQIVDKNIELNKGGTANSGAGSGLDI